jgi:4'-phosphopantetheinyl transferase
MRLEGDVLAGRAELARLASGEVHLWWAHVPEPGPGDGWQVGRRALPVGELEQLQRRLRVADQRLYLAAHAMLRAVLGHYLGMEPAAVALGAGEHGKPYHDNEPVVELSLTHSAGVAVVALATRGPVGVDVESRIRRCQPQEIAERYFTPHESAAILGVPEARRPRRFFLYWTMKEAVLKATGTGLTMPLHSVSCTLAGRRDWSVATAPGLGPLDASWRVAALALGARHLVSVAAASARPATVLRCRPFLVGDEPIANLRLIGCDALSQESTRLERGGAVRLLA